MTDKGPQPLAPGSGWFQGTGEDDRVAAAQGLLRDARDAQNDPNPTRFEKLLVGRAAYDILRGAEANPQLVSKLLAQMIADCEADVQKQVTNLLGTADLTRQDAKDSHFRARVAKAMIALLHKYVQLGEEAQDQLNNQADYEE